MISLIRTSCDVYLSLPFWSEVKAENSYVHPRGTYVVGVLGNLRGRLVAVTTRSLLIARLTARY